MSLPHLTNPDVVPDEPLSPQEAARQANRRRLFRRIAIIHNVSEFRKLFDIASLRLHPLTADRQGQYALTLTGRWRLILTVVGDTAVIEEVSHYVD